MKREGGVCDNYQTFSGAVKEKRRERPVITCFGDHSFRKGVQAGCHVIPGLSQTRKDENLTRPNQLNISKNFNSNSDIERV